jgi:thymidylate kinase
MKMFSVALVGPDGSGKTTISRRLQESLSLPVKYVYMGVNPDSSNLMLPTTRLAHRIKRVLGVKPSERGPRDPNEVKPQPKSSAKRALLTVKSGLRLINQLAEEWFRQGLTWYYEWRGYIVLFDRHFFCDYYAYDIAPTEQKKPLSRRIHGFMLKRIYPKPDLMLYLDAPADVLLARKGEGTLEILEGRRQAYMEMRDLVPCFVRVDATQPESAVLSDVSNHILDFRRKYSQR